MTFIPVPNMNPTPTIIEINWWKQDLLTNLNNSEVFDLLKNELSQFITLKKTSNMWYSIISWIGVLWMVVLLCLLFLNMLGSSAVSIIMYFTLWLILTAAIMSSIYSIIKESEYKDIFHFKNNNNKEEWLWTFEGRMYDSLYNKAYWKHIHRTFLFDTSMLENIYKWLLYVEYKWNEQDKSEIGWYIMSWIDLIENKTFGKFYSIVMGDIEAISNVEDREIYDFYQK